MITEPSEAIDEVYGVFYEAWSAHPDTQGVEVFWDNVRDDIDRDGDPLGNAKEHVVVSARNISDRQTSFGAQPRFEGVGVFSVFVKTPFGRGSKRGSELARIAATAVRGKRTEKGVVMRAPSTTHLGVVGIWYQTSVVAPFVYYYRGE